MAKRITATWHLESICARVPGLFWSRWCRKSDCSSPWLRLRRLLAGYNWPEPEPVTPTRGDQARKVKTGDLYPRISWSLIESVFNVCSIIAYIQRSSYDCCKLGLLQIMQRASNNTELKNFVVQGDETSKRQNKHSLVFCNPSLLF